MGACCCNTSGGSSGVGGWCHGYFEVCAVFDVHIEIAIQYFSTTPNNPSGQVPGDIINAITVAATPVPGGPVDFITPFTLGCGTGWLGSNPHNVSPTSSTLYPSGSIIERFNLNYSQQSNYSSHPWVLQGNPLTPPSGYYGGGLTSHCARIENYFQFSTASWQYTAGNQSINPRKLDENQLIDFLGLHTQAPSHPFGSNVHHRGTIIGRWYDITSLAPQLGINSTVLGNSQIWIKPCDWGQTCTWGGQGIWNANGVGSGANNFNSIGGHKFQLHESQFLPYSPCHLGPQPDPTWNCKITPGSHHGTAFYGIPPTYSCVDPGDGTGQYTCLSGGPNCCEENCIDPDMLAFTSTLYQVSIPGCMDNGNMPSSGVNAYTNNQGGMGSVTPPDSALNYNPLANVDDGSCIYCEYGCTDDGNYNQTWWNDPLSNNTNIAYSTITSVGTYPAITALNYNPLATCDDGSCLYDPLNISTIPECKRTLSCPCGWKPRYDFPNPGDLACEKSIASNNIAGVIAAIERNCMKLKNMHSGPNMGLVTTPLVKDSWYYPSHPGILDIVTGLPLDLGLYHTISPAPETLSWENVYIVEMGEPPVPCNCVTENLCNYAMPSWQASTQSPCHCEIPTYIDQWPGPLLMTGQQTADDTAVVKKINKIKIEGVGGGIGGYRNIPSSGDLRKISIIGTPGAGFSLTIKNSNGDSILATPMNYITIPEIGNIETSTDDNLRNVYPTYGSNVTSYSGSSSSSANVTYSFNQIFPPIQTEDQYDITLTPNADTILSNLIPITIPTYSLKQYADVIVTLTNTNEEFSGGDSISVVLPTDVTIVGEANTVGEYTKNLARGYTSTSPSSYDINIDLDIAKSASGFLYLKKPLSKNDWTDSTRILKKIEEDCDGNKIKISPSTVGIVKGMVFVIPYEVKKTVLSRDDTTAEESYDKYRLDNVEYIKAGMMLITEQINQTVYVTNVDTTCNTITISRKVYIKNNSKLKFKINARGAVDSVDDNYYITSDGSVVAPVGSDITFLRDSVTNWAHDLTCTSGATTVNISGTITITEFGTENVTLTQNLFNVLTYTPNAHDQHIGVAKDTAFTFDLLAPDSDLNRASKTPAIVSTPARGALSGITASAETAVAGFGDIVYTPTTGFTGVDLFTFKVNDGTTNSDTKTIYITVT